MSLIQTMYHAMEADTFTHRALPLETCVYTFALPVTWRRPKDQSTTHDASCELLTFLFHGERHTWAFFCVQVQCSAWLPFWLDSVIGSFWELDMEVAQLHERLHDC